MTPAPMFSTRPNLYTLMLLALSIPIGLYSLLVALSAGFQSNKLANLSSIVGVIAVVVGLPALGILLIHLLRRLRQKHAEYEFGIELPTCPHCGYDLRASPDHCPECGHPVPPLDRTIIQYLIRLRRKS